MEDKDSKDIVPVHLILGPSDYAKIKTETAPCVGALGEPMGEDQARLDHNVSWEGSGFNYSVLHTNLTDRLWQLMQVRCTGPGWYVHWWQAEVYAEFKEQFTQDAEGWYEMGLPWRGNHPSLSNNGVRTFRWLGNLVRKLRSQGTIEHYDQVIQDQIEAGIVERVSGPVTGSREFYIPHKPVVCESAETTKLRVVYDASAHAHSGAPLLNECLNAGLPFRTSCGVFWQKQSSQHLWRYLLKGHLSCTSGTQTWRSWRKHVQ